MNDGRDRGGSLACEVEKLREEAKEQKNLIKSWAKKQQSGQSTSVLSVKQEATKWTEYMCPER